MLTGLWHHGEFIAALVKRDLQSRYLRTAWGAAWLVIHPAIQIFIYIMIFSEVLGARLPGAEGRFSYGIYLCAGVLTWGFFSEVISRSQNMFMDYAGLLKKIRFPYLTLPVTLVCSAGFTFLIIFGLFLIFLLFSGFWPGWMTLMFVPVLLVQTAFSVGLGLITGTLNVFYRDVGQTMGVILQFWFWLTPIVYPAENLPEAVQNWTYLNPMYTIVEGYQRIAVWQAMPNLHQLAYTALFSSALLGAAFWLFRRAAADIVDEL